MLRICKKCGEEKEIEEFSKTKNCRHGHGWTCKKCTNIYYQKRMTTFQRKEFNHTYYQANKKKLLEKSKRYQTINRKEILSYSKQYKQNLSKGYVVSLLNRKLGRKYITPEMIEIKRELILFHRLEREVLNGLNSRGNQRTQAYGKAA